MKTAIFDFELPHERIATEPVDPRDAARMLVIPSGEEVVDECVRTLPSLLHAGDVMVFNDTRVIPARLAGRRGEAKVEVTLHKRLFNHPSVDAYPPDETQEDVTPLHDASILWQAFARPAKKLKVGDSFTVAEGFSAVVQEKLEDGQVLLAFAGPSSQFYTQLHQHGQMPLPPYMRREADKQDQEHYQTVYAQHEGSVAAPTAGLHFTPELLSAIDARGVQCVSVTLHVGGGTFLPVKTEDTCEHVMHSEYAELSAETAEIINRAKREGRRVIAVGTTSLRTLESATDAEGTLHPMQRETDIFITPGYRFRAVDVLMTNFHLPRSTLFMLVSAFCGLEQMKSAYAHAIQQGYRFYSYGDACLLYRQT